VFSEFQQSLYSLVSTRHLIQNGQKCLEIISSLQVIFGIIINQLEPRVLILMSVFHWYLFNGTLWE